ncbi:MAG: hypothetical protein LBK70_02015 [Clostridiales bacterium]|jgi:GTP cyclohydrolase III|nr:hypothetical protein [Clostridiales bacterium]
MSKLRKQNVLIASLVVVLALSVVIAAIIIFRSTLPNQQGDDRDRRDDINQPVSTINVHQWLQDNPSDIIAHVDLGSSNTVAVQQDDNTTKIFDNTSFGNINNTYPNINTAILDFYLDLDNYGAGIYRYSFRIVFDNIDQTVQSYALVTIAIHKKSQASNDFEAYLLGDKTDQPLRLGSITNRISVNFGVNFAKHKTTVNFGVNDASQGLAKTSNYKPVSYYRMLADDSRSYPTTIRSISYASTTPHTFDNNASYAERQAPSIDVRSLQLLA